MAISSKSFGSCWEENIRKDKKKRSDSRDEDRHQVELNNGTILAVGVTRNSGFMTKSACLDQGWPARD